MPIWQMTGREFIELQKQTTSSNATQTQTEKPSKEYVYGIAGIAKLFGCSISTANRIKASGKIDLAIKQSGRKIVVDANYALELFGKKIGGRR